MTPLTAEQLRQIKDYPALIEFLRDELKWELDAEDIDDLSFDYEPQELGLSDEVAVKINFIKQLRPLKDNQPWGIFYIDFEPKKLPVVVLRRILQKLVIKKRITANTPESRVWQLHDLLFINAFGIEDDRAITFAHFNQPDPDTLPTLKVVGWDGQDTPLHLDRCLTELAYLRFDPELDADQWRDQWSRAFTTGLYHSIKTSKLLATTLARLAQRIRQNACFILRYEKSDGPFHAMMAKFKQALIHDLSEDDFADMYAQTIAYGLLYTAIRSHVSGEASPVSSERVQQLVLPTNPFLKEVMEGFFNIGTRKWDADKEKITGIDFDELGINEIIAALKDEKTDFDAILRDFGNKNPNEDPVIHFYELFLKEYDALKRKSRGVYYTPQPVVGFIVRSVHEVLKRDFGLTYGLADTATWGDMIAKNPDITLPDGVSKDDFFVQILDPATGTGTFLVETIDLIHKTMVAEWKKHGLDEKQIEKQWNQYVPEKLLPRLYGFELMMAPYAIAHMKIGVKLYETGYRFADTSKRVQVYLTNTLEEPVDVTGYLATLDPAMAEETREANTVKQKNSITVVIGNPPYAGHSFNASKIKTIIQPGQSYQTFSRKKGRYITKIAGSKGAVQERVTWVGNLIQNYFQVDGQPLNEKNPKWLNDDYVKFIRYSQYRIDCAGTGVLGFITNHSYIDNPTFRGMRQSLMNTFPKMYLVDLHGNSKKKEKSPDGSKDENVFEIQQGVAINIATKISSGEPVYVYHHVWGTRKAKFNQIQQYNSFTLKPRLPLNPASNMYLLCPQDATLQSEFDQYTIINAIFPVNSAGVVTARDNLTIQESPNTVWNIIKDFISLQVEAARKKYHLGSDARDWKVAFAQGDIKKSGPNKERIVPILYRPFDNKWTYYTGRSRGYICMPRPEVMRHMLAGGNLGLITCRQRSQGEGDWASVGITSIIIESCAISNKTKEINYLLPLYLYPEDDLFGKDETIWPAGKDGRTPNLDPAFVNAFSESVGLSFVSDGKGDLHTTYGPEDLLAYIYAVFHSPTYRSRYAEFLKIDFPRVPTPSAAELFGKLAKLGAALMALHLLEADVLNRPITTFPVAGDNAVTKVGERGKTLAEVKDGLGRLYINKTQYFDKLPVEVWNFHIGGYQVCYKWLYDRKKAARRLTDDDITHYHKIVVALAETIKLMTQIDNTIESHGGWPGAFDSKG